MILIKEYQVVDRKSLLAFEQLWINKLKSINKNNSFRIKWLYHKEYDKQYRLVNKEVISEKRKVYREQNKQSISEKNKKYRERNKKILSDKKKEKFECMCGGTWSRGHGFRLHEKTKKHQKYLESL